MEFPGGCTLILDLETLALRYAITKPIIDPDRETKFRQWIADDPAVALLARIHEPIAHLHLNA